MAQRGKSARISKPTLVDPEATGGDTAEGGFTFQHNAVLARIPLWLACDGFTDMIREALGDAEARFFVPALGTAREFLEYKNHVVAPAEFWKEIGHFRRMDAEHLGSYWRFILACTGVSDTLHPMVAALGRVRDAFPFYAGAPSIQEASYAAFVETVTKLGKDRDMAAFLFAKVFVNAEAPRDAEQGFGVFRSALEHHLPAFQELGQKPARAAWEALEALVRSRKATPISRAELEQALWKGVEGAPPPAHPIRLATSDDSLPSAWELPQQIRFDWDALPGGGERAVPETEAWNRIVVGQLNATREWIVRTGRPRRIALTGKRRLSAAVAIGAAFSAVAGFAIDFHYRGGVWPTDDHDTQDTPPLAWQISAPAESAGELAVAIGIGRNPGPDARAYLDASDLKLPILTLFSGDALLSAKHTNRAVKEAKSAIAEALTATGANVIHLFIAGPSHFALFLGHRLNAVGTIQCYERVSPNVYAPTCRLAVT
ncbi:MAG: SAVED domain-containing protein [Chloroflexota bacterium]|nr:MAG: SAVED domain-containing protein [Chloroflexota bacterium]